MEVLLPAVLFCAVNAQNGEVGAYVWLSSVISRRVLSTAGHTHLAVLRTPIKEKKESHIYTANSVLCSHGTEEYRGGGGGGCRCKGKMLHLLHIHGISCGYGCLRWEYH